MGATTARTDFSRHRQHENFTGNKLSHLGFMLHPLKEYTLQCTILQSGWLASAGRGTAGYDIKVLTFWTMPQSTSPTFGVMRNVRPK